MHGLAILYDVFGDHMQTLALPQAFDRLGQEFPAFYCRLREEYLGLTSIELVSGDMPLKAKGGEVERGVGFLNKWANRGDAAFYDFWV